jgi:hypothetical protein
MNESVIQIKDVTGNPAPLGLLGFGMMTVLLNLHNAGFYELNSMILAMGICLWWRRPNYRRHYGVEERQYVCYNCVSFLRLVLVFARHADCYGKIMVGRRLKRHGNGSVPCHVGPVHCRHVYRQVATTIALYRLCLLR